MVVTQFLDTLEFFGFFLSLFFQSLCFSDLEVSIEIPSNKRILSSAVSNLLLSLLKALFIFVTVVFFFFNLFVFFFCLFYFISSIHFWFLGFSSL